MSSDSYSPPSPKRPKTEQTTLTSFFKSSKPSIQKQESNDTGDAQPPAPSKTQQDETESKMPPQDNNKNDTDDDSAEPIIPHTVTPSSNAKWRVYQNACIYRINKNDPPRTKVAGFDLDGTLLEWRIAGWPSRMEHYELWNGSVVTKLRELYDEQNCKLVIFSNQGAIRGAFEGKKATFVKSLFEWLAHTIDRPVSVVMSTSKKNGYHKPEPNMWMVAQECCNKGEPFDVANSFFVGDSVGGADDPQGGVDVAFAKNVGDQYGGGSSLQFYTPQDYFGPSHKEMRSKLHEATYETPSLEVLQTRAALTGGYLQGPILLILCGAQGSGKSTFSAQLMHNNDEHWVHLSQDTINKGKPGKREMVEQAATCALRDENKSVIVDRMHLDETQRAYFVQVGQTVGVPVHAVVLTPSKDVLAQRVQERQDHPGNVQGDKGAKMAVSSSAQLNFPSHKEGIDLISASSTVEGAAKIVELYRKVSSVDKVVIPKKLIMSSGNPIPSVALGTMGLGRKVASTVVSTACDLGFEAVDTAPTYKNEDKVGEEIKEVTFCIVKIPKSATTAEQVRQELSDSLKNLKRESADLLLLHWPSDVIAAETLKEVWQEMEKLVGEGLAKSIGVCNFNVKALCMLLPHCTIRPAVNQVERHPRLPQWDLVDFCAQKDILLQAHSPLGQGKDDLLEHAVVKQVAANTGASPAQVVLLWNLQQGVAVSPKASSEEHLQEILAVPGMDGLSPLDMKALNEITDQKRFVKPPFMYGSEPYCWGQRPPN